MEEGGGWRSVLNVVGTLGGAVGLVYVVGGGALSLRYEAFGLSGQRSVPLLQREYAFYAGLRSLVIWGLIGVAVFYSLSTAAQRIRGEPLARLKTMRGRVAAAAVVAALIVLLLFTLRVWWPLAAVLGLLAALAAQLYWQARRVARVAVAVAAIVLIAVTYEADRITYRLERVYVALAGDVKPRDVTVVPQQAGRADKTPRTALYLEDGKTQPLCTPRADLLCGILIAQTGSGIYLGSPDGASGRGPYPGAVVFLPDRNIASFSVEKIQARAAPLVVKRRRKTLSKRIWDAF